jgi:tripartite-type tricarboxylate transporter receptor subunit TctC
MPSRTATVAAQYMNSNANAISDLQNIALFGAEPAALVARSDQPFKTLAEYVEAAKAAPGKIRNGNDQPGGASFTFMALYERALGIKAHKVSYAGYAPMVTALLSGEVQTIAIAVPDVVEHHKAGKVRILGVSGNKRHFLVPDVPTFREQGFDLVIGSFRTIAGPKGIPAERLAILEKAFVDAMSDPKFIERAQARGFIVEPEGAKGAQAIMDELDSRLYPTLKEAGLVKARMRD